LSIVANCCLHVSTRDDFNYVRSHLDYLANRLRSDDKKTLEHICHIYARLVENFHRDSSILHEIASEHLLKILQNLLTVQPTLLTSMTFVSIIHMLYMISAYCPQLAVHLLKMNMAETLITLLIGSNEHRQTMRTIPITYKSAALANHSTNPLIPSMQSIELLSRTPQELFEIVSLIGEMMPRLPNDETLFQVDQFYRGTTTTTAMTQRMSDTTMMHQHVLWHWQDDQGQLRPYSIQDSRTIEHAWQQHDDEVQLNIAGRLYLIDLQQLQQINEETNQARFIKRSIAMTTNESTTSLSTEYVVVLCTVIVDKNTSYLSVNRSFFMFLDRSMASFRITIVIH
jgi:E3 ubiquitin-protein ligase TRIP12